MKSFSSSSTLNLPPFRGRFEWTSQGHSKRSFAHHIKKMLISVEIQTSPRDDTVCIAQWKIIGTKICFIYFQTFTKNLIFFHFWCLFGFTRNIPLCNAPSRQADNGKDRAQIFTTFAKNPSNHHPVFGVHIRRQPSEYTVQGLNFPMCDVSLFVFLHNLMTMGNFLHRPLYHWISPHFLPISCRACSDRLISLKSQ